MRFSIAPMQVHPAQNDKPRLLISIAAAGGALAVYGKVIDSGDYLYKVMITDQTPSFLDEDEAASSIRRDSGWLPGWAEAIKSLSRYPWPQLAGMFVDPTVQQAVWVAIQNYQRLAPRPVRDGALARWRKACGINTQPDGAPWR
jgi:hypothetical protein